MWNEQQMFRNLRRDINLTSHTPFHILSSIGPPEQCNQVYQQLNKPEIPLNNIYK
jgi:hypothetical protein